MSVGFGASAFLISAIVIGLDPENLAVAGAAMVAIALAFGITAMLAPMRFAEAYKPGVAVPTLVVLRLYVLGAGGARQGVGKGSGATVGLKYGGRGLSTKK